MKKDIYRKAALERLATADQLNKMMKITSPLSWLALLGVTFIIVAVVIWSFTGSLPSTVSANGLIVSSSTATNTLVANGEGTVVLYVSEGQYINKGDIIAKITPNNIYEEPIDRLADQQCWASDILVSDGTAVTSGTYERKFEQDGVLYHHILDPATGYPCETDVASVTVVSTLDSADCDALSTMCLLYGLEDGLELIESLDGVEAVFVTDSGEVHCSSGAEFEAL